MLTRLGLVGIPLEPDGLLDPGSPSTSPEEADEEDESMVKIDRVLSAVGILRVGVGRSGGTIEPYMGLLVSTLSEGFLPPCPYPCACPYPFLLDLGSEPDA